MLGLHPDAVHLKRTMKFIARRKGIPNLPRFACADRPLAASASLRWGDPSPCALLPPPSPGGVRHVHAAFQRGRAKANTQGGSTHEHHQHRYPHQRNPKQPQQRQTAKDIIAANVKSLIEQLEAGHSDALTAYLDAMSRFHNYSFGNILEIARQRPTATRVAGLYAWNQLGRKVKKGEKGIRILAPIVGIKRKKDEEANKDITKQNTAFWLDSAMPTSSTWSRPKAQSFPPCGR